MPAERPCVNICARAVVLWALITPSRQMEDEGISNFPWLTGLLGSANIYDSAGYQAGTIVIQGERSFNGRCRRPCRKHDSLPRLVVHLGSVSDEGEVPGHGR